jgi:tetrahedral aminopeptidase
MDTANSNELSIPQLGPEQVSLLERLSNACAISGDENEVRAIVLEAVKPFADEIKVDALGNVLAVRKAQKTPALKVMLTAHMDEIGFMITQSEENGFFHFQPVGGIDERQIPGKTVWIGRDHIPGVIGPRPIHLLKDEDLKNTIPLDSLHIDTGDSGKIQPGDRAAFATTFQQLGPSLVGKALDDRLGVATLIELFKHAPEHIEFQAAFTVQEEIGLRGARVAAYAFNPDMCFTIDSTPARDLPTWDHTENAIYNTRLGEGAAIYIADTATISDPRLVKFLEKTAIEHNIKYQYRQPGGGGTDAGAVHRSRGGIPSVSISIPGRYAHTAVMVARMSDWQCVFSLLYAALHTLPADLLSEPR